MIVNHYVIHVIRSHSIRPMDLQRQHSCSTTDLFHVIIFHDLDDILLEIPWGNFEYCTDCDQHRLTLDWFKFTNPCCWLYDFDL